MNGSECHPEVSQLVVLGTPGSRRVRLFEAAAARLVSVPVVVVSYADWLSGRVDLNVFNSPSTLVRVDSPGECWPVERRCLELGASEAEAIGLDVVCVPKSAAAAPCRGRILQPSQWFFGFRRLLRRLERLLPEAQWMSPPETIARMFDKLSVTEEWAARRLPVPGACGSPAGYDEVRELLQFHDRLFLKHRYGFSATGAVALHRQRAGIRAITATELAGDELYLSKRLQVLRSESGIARLVDRLAGQGLIAQPWLPKARINGRNFDLRIVAVKGRMMHVVGRSSGSPFTNLNLDASRLSAAVLKLRLDESFGKSFWSRLEELVATAMSSFRDALCCGLDVLVRPGGNLVLLEANAFGDYLPRLTWEDKSTHEAELESLIRHRRIAAKGDEELVPA